LRAGLSSDQIDGGSGVKFNNIALFDYSGIIFSFFSFIAAASQGLSTRLTLEIRPLLYKTSSL